MIRILVEGEADRGDVVRSALGAEARRLELALARTEEKLAALERRNKITSIEFTSRCVAEDLDGGDGEFVAWTGEIGLKEHLEQKLGELRRVEYVLQ